MYICINHLGYPLDAYNAKNASYVTDGEVIDIIRSDYVLRYTGKEYSVRLTNYSALTLRNMGYIIIG